MNSALIVNSQNFRCTDKMLLGHIKEHLRIARKFDCFMVDNSEFSKTLLSDFLIETKLFKGYKPGGTTVISANLNDLLAAPKTLQSFQLVMLNILGFSDELMESLESVISQHCDQLKQTIRVFRWHRFKPDSGLELIDFSYLSLSSRYRSLEVNLLDGSAKVKVVSSPMFFDGKWRVEVVRLGSNLRETIPFESLDLTVFIDVIF